MMTPHARLRLVERPAHDPARWFVSGAHPANAPAPRVLCAEVARRLSLLNAAVRRLRGWGIAVEAQLIDGAWPAEDRPVIRIRRNPETSIAPLLDACPTRTQVPTLEGVIWTVLLDEVAVTWREQ